MKDTRSKAEVEPGLDTLVATAIVVSAAELGRRGHYATAERLLRDRIATGTSEPEVLDLLARIKVQQGQLRDAEEQWRRASSLDPANRSYRAALRRLARIQKRQARWPWLVLGRFSIIAAAAGLLIFAVWLMAERLGALEKRVANLGAAQDAGHQALTERMAEVEIAQVRTGEQAAPPELQIDLPGVSLRHVGPAVIATFEEGLFSEADRLRIEARELLTTLGRSLEPQAKEIAIHAIGHSDNLRLREDSAFKDNAALGLSRAVAVVEHLRSSTTLPAEVFHIQTAGARSPPYPNDSPDNQARNRTAVLRITKALAAGPE